MVKCGCEGESGIDASIACLLTDVSVEGCVCMVWGGGCKCGCDGYGIVVRM